MTYLSDHGLLKISGNDAKKLLQGQLTCDVDTILTTDIRLSAHCNPQGRVISLFYLFQYQDAYYLLLPHNMVTLTLAALKKYAVFYKVELSDASELLTHQLIAESPIASLPFAIATDWKKQHIDAGIPLIYPDTSGKFLPHELNLHELNAISFNKGCYTGQEIIARMHYRAKLKKHLYHATIVGPNKPLAGADVYAESFNIIAQVVDSYDEANEIGYPALIVTEEDNAKKEFRVRVKT